jgi:hypothetical protein
MSIALLDTSDMTYSSPAVSADDLLSHTIGPANSLHHRHTIESASQPQLNDFPYYTHSLQNTLQPSDYTLDLACVGDWQTGMLSFFRQDFTVPTERP